QRRKIEDALTKNNIALTENKRAYEEAKSKLASTESELQTKLEILAIYQEVENRLDEAMQQVEELEVAHAQQAIKKQLGDLQINALKTLERELASSYEIKKKLGAAKKVLEDEKKKHTTVLLLRKKFESDLAEANQRPDVEERQREEARQQFKRDLEASIKAGGPFRRAAKAERDEAIEEANAALNAK
ncbi:unnamed protein product, partial [Hymenolepis diminuta]